jgi:hypothetical protein
LHATPLTPQAVTSVAPPKLQVWLLQQPGQVLAEQPVVQLLPSQTSVAPHFLHTMPPEPHAPTSLPAWQASPAQQPVQDFVVHVHFPSTHSWLEPQLVQAAPSLPHCAPDGVLMHAPLSQQPSGQVVASQVGGAASQVRSLHTSPDAHVLHDAPPLPHADTAVPGMHFPSTSQQPEAQVEALHVTPMQLWFWHCFPWPQATQGAPPVPH